MSNLNLLSDMNRVQAPFVKVTIGSYTFGVYSTSKSNRKSDDDFYQQVGIMYPNFIESLQVVKINGQVNQYTLNIKYPITPEDDPNFFEKVFSSVSETRSIIFTYGDYLNPDAIYKEEKAIILQINPSINGNVINYTISAQSSAILSQTGYYTFINTGKIKPSDAIFNLLYNKEYGLLDLFYGMSNKELVRTLQLIPSDDSIVELDSKENIQLLDYLKYLVSCMRPSSSSRSNNNEFYTITFADNLSDANDLKGIYGPYFKISKISNLDEDDNAYTVDVNCPSKNIVLNFNASNNNTYSIMYNYQNELDQKAYKPRLNDKGEWEYVYAPQISTNSNAHMTRENEQNWWNKMTQYPVSANLTIMGLLKPAILMSNVKINIYFYGKKYIYSGLYIVTKQVDSISSRGYQTSLSVTRLSNDA